MKKSKAKFKKSEQTTDKDAKFYSSYDGLGEWEIITKEKRDSLMKDIDVRESGQLDYYKFMFPHRTFTEAKSRVLMNLRGDVDEARMAIIHCKRLKISQLKKS